MGESNVIQVPFSLQMVTYQCAEFLPEAVESALSQTFKNFELIIVNDGSTDNSQHFLSNIKDPRVKVFETPHLGLIAARNLALKKSMGLWTAIWDADDISLPNRLQLCWETIHDFDKKKR
jgi:glycosyltransferase involved in cell wall biosynthesis